MPSVIGLLEARERAAAQRVEILREEADRVLSELQDAELDWERTVVEVLTGLDGAQKAEASAPGNPEPSPSPGGSALRSVVTAWRDGLDVSVLSPEYQRIMAVLTAAGSALTCKELASGLGVDAVAKTKVEGARSKTNRLVARGWLVKEPSGRFTLAPGLRGGRS